MHPVNASGMQYHNYKKTTVKFSHKTHNNDQQKLRMNYSLKERKGTTKRTKVPETDA